MPGKPNMEDIADSTDEIVYTQAWLACLPIVLRWDGGASAASRGSKDRVDRDNLFSQTDNTPHIDRISS
jgi:hypothetical protein